MTLLRLSREEYLSKQVIGKLQRKMLGIIKREKQISIIDVGKRLGYYPDKMGNIHGGLQSLQERGNVEIKLKPGFKRNYRYVVFVKDYEEPPPKPPITEYEIKERQVRRIIRGLQTIKKDEKALKRLEFFMRKTQMPFDKVERMIQRCLPAAATNDQ